MIRQINSNTMSGYHKHLQQEEYMDSTIKKYLRDIRIFAAWLGDQKNDPDTRAEMEAKKNRDVTVDKNAVAAWKAYLIEEGYASVTVNAMLSSLNGFFDFLGWEECKVKFLKIQRRIFRNQERELSKAEYQHLRDSAMLELLYATGIRVSEVKYITVEAITQRRADISLKGKVRTILLPGKLCKKLKAYAKKLKIKSGEIFITKNGKGISRHQIWGEMKRLCEKAEVNPTKVFPHNLRHLFARTFYGLSRDIVKLADVLGHSSIETTRIYLISTGETHARQMERMGLIS